MCAPVREHLRRSSQQASERHLEQQQQQQLEMQQRQQEQLQLQQEQQQLQQLQLQLLQQQQQQLPCSPCFDLSRAFSDPMINMQPTQVCVCVCGGVLLGGTPVGLLFACMCQGRGLLSAAVALGAVAAASVFWAEHRLSHVLPAHIHLKP